MEREADGLTERDREARRDRRADCSRKRQICRQRQREPGKVKCMVKEGTLAWREGFITCWQALTAKEGDDQKFPSIVSWDVR